MARGGKTSPLVPWRSAPHRPIPGTAVYHVSVDDHPVQVGEYDLDGPLRDLVAVRAGDGPGDLRARAEATPDPVCRLVP